MIEHTRHFYQYSSGLQSKCDGVQFTHLLYNMQEYAITGMSPRLLTLAYPAVQSNTAMTDPVDLLHQLTPRPHFVVMTGTCCANRGDAQLGDVCVVRSGDRQLSLMAELEHKMEIWRMKHGSLVPQGLEPPRSVYQQMVCLARIFTELQVLHTKAWTSHVCVCICEFSSCLRRRGVSGTRG